jgi:S1-C subfamily serine protease
MEGQKEKTLAPSAQWGVVCTKDKGDEEDGIDVKLVVPGGAAEKGGMKKGDRLLTLDGRWTDSMPDLFEAATFVKAGRTVKVKVKRDGKEVVLKVTPTKGM